jgi:predicted DNA-binding transcriptional regulator AlpA
MEAKKRNRLLQMEQLEEYVLLTETQIRCLIKKGEFPTPYTVGYPGEPIGWSESEIIEWQYQHPGHRSLFLNDETDWPYP